MLFSYLLVFPTHSVTLLVRHYTYIVYAVSLIFVKLASDSADQQAVRVLVVSTEIASLVGCSGSLSMESTDTGTCEVYWAVLRVTIKPIGVCTGRSLLY